jgi:hypothetical protein
MISRECTAGNESIELVIILRPCGAGESFYELQRKPIGVQLQKAIPRNSLGIDRGSIGDP